MCGGMKRPITESERRRLSLEHRQRAAERMGVSNDEAPGLGMRIAPEPLRLGTGNSFVPLLVPDRTLKPAAGRYPSRAIVAKLRRSLAVHSLMALHGLQPLLGTRQAARNRIATVAPSGIDHLMREGRQYLSQETAFESEEELRRLFGRKRELLKDAGIDIPWRREELVEAELAAVRLVSIASVRAQTILSAFEAAQRTARPGRTANGDEEAVIDETAWQAIRETFGRYRPDLGIGSLWEIAAYADINPCTLWPQHTARFATLFELARFIGRIDRGIEVSLACVHLDLLEAVLTEMPDPFDEDQAQLAMVSRVKLRQHFRQEALLTVAGEARREGASLRIARGTRALSLAEPPGPHASAGSGNPPA